MLSVVAAALGPSHREWGGGSWDQQHRQSSSGSVASAVMLSVTFNTDLRCRRRLQGDLFHLRGQISESEVKSIMYQLLQVGARVCMCVHQCWLADLRCAYACVCTVRL